MDERRDLSGWFAPALITPHGLDKLTDAPPPAQNSTLSDQRNICGCVHQCVTGSLCIWGCSPRRPPVTFHPPSLHLSLLGWQLLMLDESINRSVACSLSPCGFIPDLFPSDSCVNMQQLEPFKCFYSFFALSKLVLEDCVSSPSEECVLPCMCVCVLCVRGVLQLKKVEKKKTPNKTKRLNVVKVIPSVSCCWA